MLKILKNLTKVGLLLESTKDFSRTETFLEKRTIARKDNDFAQQ